MRICFVLLLMLFMASCTPQSQVGIGLVDQLIEGNAKLTQILDVFLDFKDCNWHVTEITGEGKEFFVLAILLDSDEDFKDVDEVLISTKKKNNGYMNLK